MDVIEHCRRGNDETFFVPFERQIDKNTFARPQQGLGLGHRVVEVNRGSGGIAAKWRPYRHSSSRCVSFPKPGHRNRQGLVDGVRFTGIDRDSYPQRIDLGDLEKGGGSRNRLPGRGRDTLNDPVERCRHDELALLADRVVRHACKPIARGRQRGLSNLVLRPRLFDASHACGTVGEQLLEPLQALACRQLFGFCGGDRPLRLDALVALGRHEGRNRHQAIALADTGTCRWS